MATSFYKCHFRANTYAIVLKRHCRMLTEWRRMSANGAYVWACRREAVLMDVSRTEPGIDNIQDEIRNYETGRLRMDNGVVYVR